MWRFLAVVLIVAALTIGVLWYGGWLPFDAEAVGSTRNGGSTAPGAVFQVDNPLDVGKGAKPLAAAGVAAPRPDTITITDMALTPIHETEISSRIDGRIQEFPVKLGQFVKKGDRLCTLEDDVAKRAVQIATIKGESGVSKIKAADLQYKALSQICDQDGRAGLAVSLQEKTIHITQRDKALVDIKIAEDEKRGADEELVKTRLEAEYNYINSNRDGKVERIYSNRKPGETVKAGEPLFKIVDDRELRAEGAMEAHLAPFVRVGMKGLIEPEIPMPAYKELRRHTGAVTSLAVTPDGRFLASASKDQSVILWDWREGRAVDRLYHQPDEVYALAAGPVQKNDQGQTVYTFLAGCDHARVVLWRVTVDATGRPVNKEAVELKDGHRDRAPVRCVTISENGKYAVTGGDDYQICLWDLDAGKLAYRVQERAGEKEKAHSGAVTTLHILPDGHLLSAAADKLLKKWKLGPDSAQFVMSEKDRSGDVRQLGITADGKQVLFDTGEELRILDTSDGAPLGVLQTRRQQSRFSQLAVFSPGGRSILTVSAGRLQLWAAPTSTSGRTLNGFEIRQLIVPDATQVTCGAFYAPGELGEEDPKQPTPSYCFTAGEDRTIRVWQCPPASERVEPIEAVITYVGQQVERGSSAGLLHVRAEFKNPTDPARRLMAGRHVSLTLYPETTAKR